MEERLKLSFDALEDALKRIGTYDPDNRFAPLAETLLWIDLIDTAFYNDDEDKYVVARKEKPGGILVRGLRYARNRLTHDVMVYGMHEMQYEGGDFNAKDSSHRDFNVGTPTWRWRIVDDLPTYTWKNKEIQDIYEDELEGKEVEPILNDAANFLRLYRTGWVPTQEEE